MVVIINFFLDFARGLVVMTSEGIRLRGRVHELLPRFPFRRVVVVDDVAALLLLPSCLCFSRVDAVSTRALLMPRVSSSSPHFELTSASAADALVLASLSLPSALLLVHPFPLLRPTRRRRETARDVAHLRDPSA